MEKLFSSSIDQGLFIGIFIIWCLIILSERLVIKKHDNIQVKEKKDKGTYFLVYFTVLFSISISFILSSEEITRLPYLIFYIGIGFVIIGILVREYSFYTLGSFFSFEIKVFEGHKLIDKGPYKFIRHPAYSGLVLSIIGISLCVRSLIAVLIVMIMCFIAVGLRIKFEENLLFIKFGQDFVNYKKKTKKVIPFIY